MRDACRAGVQYAHAHVDAELMRFLAGFVGGPGDCRAVTAHFATLVLSLCEDIGNDAGGSSKRALSPGDRETSVQRTQGVSAECCGMRGAPSARDAMRQPGGGAAKGRAKSTLRCAARHAIGQHLCWVESLLERAVARRALPVPHEARGGRSGQSPAEQARRVRAEQLLQLRRAHAERAELGHDPLEHMAEAAAAIHGELQRRTHTAAQQQLPAEALAHLARDRARVRVRVKVGVRFGVRVGVRVRIRVRVRPNSNPCPHKPSRTSTATSRATTPSLGGSAHGAVLLSAPATAHPLPSPSKQRVHPRRSVERSASGAPSRCCAWLSTTRLTSAPCAHISRTAAAASAAAASAAASVAAAASVTDAGSGAASFATGGASAHQIGAPVRICAIAAACSSVACVSLHSACCAAISPITPAHTPPSPGTATPVVSSNTI
eukprot:scaffold7730_cov70-Phaeocystis_antarctica.AAC.1